MSLMIWCQSRQTKKTVKENSQIENKKPKTKRYIAELVDAETRKKEAVVVDGNKKLSAVKLIRT